MRYLFYHIAKAIANFLWAHGAVPPGFIGFCVMGNKRIQRKSKMISGQPHRALRGFASPVLRGFSRSVKQDSEASTASGGVSAANVAPAASRLLVHPSDPLAEVQELRLFYAASAAV
jgi:hypothetical protein